MQIDVVDRRLVRLDRAVRHLDAEVALRRQHRDPEPALHAYLFLGRPERDEIGGGVAGGEDVRNRHAGNSSMAGLGTRCSSVRTSRLLSMPSTHSTTTAPAPTSVTSTLVAWATGPATTSPIGIAMNDPTMSYEYTRASFSGGMCSCMVVSQATANCSSPTPATKAAASSGTTSGAAPRTIIGRASNAVQAV